uniref:Protein brambleberry n=1 Tax=Fundulus heteroclitus TaxID=8078 RepID=A0A3Q2TIS4_FUNHE
MERVAALLLCSGLILEVSVGTEAMPGPGSVPDPERGRMELRRVQNLAAQPQFGECWTRALENLETRCKEMTSESQSRLALRFTHCHLSRLTETSAGVAEQLQATRQMANDLMEAQTDALQAQKEILSNGEQLRVTMRDSTQGLQALFSDLSSVSREQQVALSEIFNRISFMQSFLLMEAHSLSSCCYNAAALCTAYLLTSTPRSSRARLVLLALVCLNFYLERKIYQFVLGSLHPEHLHMELVSAYVGVLRRVSVGVAVCALLVACVRYRDPVQQSLQVLQQLRETHRNLQEALQLAERLTKEKKKLEDCGLHVEVRSAGGCTPEAPAAV